MKYIIILLLIALAIIPRFFTGDWEYKSFSPLKQKRIESFNEVLNSLKGKSQKTKN